MPAENIGKHLEKPDEKKIKLIGIITLVLGFAQSLLIYILSSYFMLTSGVENVSFFYLVSFSVTLIVLLNVHKIVRLLGKNNVFLLAILSKIAVLTLLLFYPPAWLAISLLMLFIVLGNLEWATLDIILESFSTDRMSGRIRGKHLTIMNLGILLGPFVSTRILEVFSYEGIFLLLMILNMVIFILALIGLRKVSERFPYELSVKQVLSKVWKRKNVKRIYAISFAMEFFYALMVIYTPLYLLEKGMGWNEIGLIFTVMLLPFVILQYPMGVLADKKVGEKEFLIGSLALTGVFTFVLYFVTTNDFWTWAILLFLTRIGIALIEVLRDSYFYKRIDGRDVDLISFYRSANAVAYIVAMAISAVFLIFFPVKGIFLIVAVVLLLALIPAFQLEDNLCEAELAGKKKGGKKGIMPSLKKRSASAMMG
jgi:MFS family permease